MTTCNELTSVRECWKSVMDLVAEEVKQEEYGEKYVYLMVVPLMFVLLKWLVGSYKNKITGASIYQVYIANILQQTVTKSNLVLHTRTFMKVDGLMTLCTASSSLDHDLDVHVQQVSIE